MVRVNISVAPPDMRLFDLQSQKDKDIKIKRKCKNNIQKQHIYKIENSDCSWIHYTEKTTSSFC